MRKPAETNTISQRLPRVSQGFRRTFDTCHLVLAGNGRQVASGAAAQFTNSQSTACTALGISPHERPNNVPTCAKPPVGLLDAMQFIVKSRVHTKSSLLGCTLLHRVGFYRSAVPQ